MAFGIHVQMDIEGLVGRLRNGEKRLAFAVAYATSAVALKVQQAEFVDVRSHLEIRYPSFFFGSSGRPGGIAAKVFRAQPTVGVMNADVVGGSGGRANRAPIVFAKFETGGVRTGNGGLAAIAITGGARPDFASRISPAARPSRLGISKADIEAGVRKQGKYFSWFARTENAPYGAIYQRLGPNDVRMLWKFQPTVPVPRRITYFATADEVWKREWLAAYKEQLLSTLKFHGVLKAA